jgi:hypothetical protein
MEAVLLAFALGASTVLAVKHGRKVARRAIGWTAERAGFVTGKVTEALEQARRTAKSRFEQGRDANGARTELAPPSSRSPASVRPPSPSRPDGATGTNGHAPLP